MKIGSIVQEGRGHVVLERDGIWYSLDALRRQTQRTASPERMSVYSVQHLLADMEVFTGIDQGLATILSIVDDFGRLEQCVIPEPREFGPPLRPGKIVALGRNYAAHAKELGNEVPEEPLFFCKSPTACIGGGTAIVVKEWYGRVHFEGEVAIVIGKRVKDVRAEEARSCIAGYTLLNDVTARDMQNEDKKRGHPWFRCKNFDTFCPIGPVIATGDSVGWPLEVEIETRVNGVVRQKGNTRDFIFGIGEMLAYITRFMTLEPGDVVSTGTPEGVGPLRVGDRVEVQVEGIGVLENEVKGEG